MEEVIRDRLRRSLSASERIGCADRLTAMSPALSFDALAWLPGEVMDRFFHMANPQRGRAAIGRRVGRTMLGIVRPNDRHGPRGGPRRDQSRLDPPYGTLPRSPQPDPRCAWRRDRMDEDSAESNRRP